MRCDPPEVTAMTDTLNLYYARIANMGDLLNPLIIERCFGYRVERCSFLTGDLCAIGSGLAQYKLHGNPLMKLQQCINGFTHPHVDVWGSGFINYDDAQGRFLMEDGTVFQAYYFNDDTISTW